MHGGKPCFQRDGAGIFELRAGRVDDVRVQIARALRLCAAEGELIDVTRPGIGGIVVVAQIDIGEHQR